MYIAQLCMGRAAWGEGGAPCWIFAPGTRMSGKKRLFCLPSEINPKCSPAVYINAISICTYISRVLGEVVFESGDITRGGSCYYDSRVLQQGEKLQVDSQILSLPISG